MFTCLEECCSSYNNNKVKFKRHFNQCEDINSNLYMKIENEIIKNFGSEINLTTDENTKTSLKKMKEYCESLIREIENSFNGKSIDIMSFVSD